MPPKGKGGNPAKGEKTFKNLCAVCHALAVSLRFRKSFVLFYFEKGLGKDIKN